jgi:hypothetical protein
MFGKKEFSYDQAVKVIRALEFHENNGGLFAKSFFEGGPAVYSGEPCHKWVQDLKVEIRPHGDSNVTLKLEGKMVRTMNIGPGGKPTKPTKDTLKFERRI